MFQAFKNRKPLAAVVISFFLSPIGGMLYLGKGFYALIYFISYIISAAVLICLRPPGLDPMSLIFSLIIVGWVVNIIGIIHSFIIARRGNGNPNKWYSKWYIVIILALILPWTLSFLFRAYAYQPFNVPTISMVPNLNKGDYFFVQKFGNENLQRGDIIVFKHTSPRPNFYVKRIIGLPGDKITYKNDVFTINGQELTQIKITGDLYSEKLPEGISHDILNKDIESNFPPSFPSSYEVPPDSYFVVGDNRANSSDSRFEQFGYIAKNNIQGKAVFDIYQDNGGRLHYKTF